MKQLSCGILVSPPLSPEVLESAIHILDDAAKEQNILTQTHKMLPLKLSS